jgi:hypothetical protein
MNSGISLVPGEVYTPIIGGEPYRDAGSGYQAARQENRFVNPGRFVSFEDISEQLDDPTRPPLDRADVNECGLTADQLFWRRNGYLVKSGLIPDEIIDPYLELRNRLGVGNGLVENYGPHARYDEIKDLCLYKPLPHLIRHLFGEDLGLHLILTSFRSSERGWHQDDYLNPPEIVGRYVAAWIALGDIHPDSGPFEFIPGSHRWGWVRRELVREYLDTEARQYGLTILDGRHWAINAELFVNPAYAEKIAREGVPSRTFLAKKGDVLLWHPNLVHRGSTPKNPEIDRPAIIPHYSSIAIRRDFGSDIRRWRDWGYYWHFDHNDGASPEHAGGAVDAKELLMQTSTGEACGNGSPVQRTERAFKRWAKRILAPTRS